MLQHAPGDKLFVDYSGLTMPVIEPRTGELRMAHMFVAALGHFGLHVRRGDVEPFCRTFEPSMEFLTP